MKILRRLAIVLLVYVGIVVLFESLLGWFQPQDARTLIIATRSADGAAHERVVSRLDSDGQIYVAANHWPRAWYRRALADPQVLVTGDGSSAPYRAVPVTPAEHRRLAAEHPLGLPVRVLTGFAPRRFLRLEPEADAGLP